MPRVSTDSLQLVNDAGTHIMRAIMALQKVKEIEASEALKSDIEWVQRALLGIGKELADLAMNASLKGGKINVEDSSR